MARKVCKAVIPRTGDAAGPITLAIDIGGSGLKMQALSPEGRPISDRLRVPTPEPATTTAILTALDELKVERSALRPGFRRFPWGDQTRQDAHRGQP